MSKTRLLTHIVFSTKHRELTLTETNKRELYAYIFGILKNKNCFLERMNGIPDHIHLLVDLHPSVAVADLVRDIKSFSHKWLKSNPHFPLFNGWGDGYYAVSVSADGLASCKQYIMEQEEHHKLHDLLFEMHQFAGSNGLSWYEDDWE